jgi:outer membrane murein-binding lipoprotein Lpp
MSSGNRVEELESRVRELEATISGLTDELVETRERLHALEEEVDPEMDIIEGKPTRSATQVDGGTEDPTDGSEDPEAAAEEAKAEGDEAEDDADSGSGDDIIVA